MPWPSRPIRLCPRSHGRPGRRQWAAEKHSSQRRDVDSAPFILHPLEVAALLSGRGYDDAVIVAGVLHDVVEKSEATIADVREAGPFVDQLAFELWALRVLPPGPQ